MDGKIIVSNRAALRAKYGRAGVTKVKKALAGLIAADAKRGIKESDYNSAVGVVPQIVLEPAPPHHHTACSTPACSSLSYRSGAAPPCCFASRALFSSSLRPPSRRRGERSCRWSSIASRQSSSSGSRRFSRYACGVPSSSARPSSER